MKPDLIKHITGEPLGRCPVWMMRQAGRYLPEYREIRKKHSFWEMVTQPEVAAEVSRLPLSVLPVDAVIFFSDILTPAYGQGLPIDLVEAVGPVNQEPLRCHDDFKVFQTFDAEKHVPYVGQALTELRETIPSEKTLIGFAGAPWTLSAYLIEGKPSRRFEVLKEWLYRDPESLSASLNEVAEMTARYLKYQVKSGAQIVQLFDTWAGEMPIEFFRDHYRPMLNRIFNAVKEENVPAVHFLKHAHHLLDEVKELNIDVLSIDSLVPLSEVDKKIDGKFSLQGNLDPHILLTSEANVRNCTRRLVSEAQALSRPAIMNLGHGIFKNTPVENAKAFIEEARVSWI